MSVVLVGQTDLRRRLAHKTYLPLRQRIGLFYHLGPIAESEIKGYVMFRLKMSGREEVLFTDEALSCLHRYSGGVPRVINSIATSALLDGFSKEIAVIDGPLIEDAVKEIGLNGYREN
jgi:type II secretory pathway predicted ATPase ExeA